MYIIPKSIRVDRDDLSAPVWLPRFAVEFADNVRLCREEIGGIVTFRLQGDMAAARGLV